MDNSNVSPVATYAKKITETMVSVEVAKSQNLVDYGDDRESFRLESGPEWVRVVGPAWVGGELRYLRESGEWNSPTHLRAGEVALVHLREEGDMRTPSVIELIRI